MNTPTLKSKPNPTAHIGSRGEALAVHYLTSIGCAILARNFRRYKGEVDIICTEGPFLVAVEVKSRSSLLHGDPETAIDQTKIDLMTMAAGFYQELHGLEQELRFDIVSVYFPKKGPAQLTHFSDAFHG
ncbi:MAG: YraN family protein [Bacteroidota bacterium]